jgi:protein ImuB
MARRFLSLYCPGHSPDALAQLTIWCDRYSPLVSQDGADGIVFDITGCAHLFGGEGPLLLDLRQRLYRMGMDSRAAIADTWGAAWALARYGKRYIVLGAAALATALDPLPLEALRLPLDATGELRRLGLTTIAALRKIPRGSLASRFGAVLLRRLDQVFQQADEPLTPWRPPGEYRASRILAEPVSTVHSVEYVLRHMLREVCARLEKDHKGSRWMELTCYRVDGTLDRCEARTSKPTRSQTHLANLFGGRLEKLRSGFGFEAFVLSVLDTEPLPPQQLLIADAAALHASDSFDVLVDRLGMRLGFEQVNRAVVQESYLPEHALMLRPASASTSSTVSTSGVKSAEWPAYRVRPIRLIEPPLGIAVLCLYAGGLPVRFFIGEQPHRIVRCEGPERLAPEWWREPASRWGTRDYYRVEDDKGLRFWIFRDTNSLESISHAPQEQWFLHGHFG